MKPDKACDGDARASAELGSTATVSSRAPRAMSRPWPTTPRCRTRWAPWRSTTGSTTSTTARRGLRGPRWPRRHELRQDALPQSGHAPLPRRRRRRRRFRLPPPQLVKCDTEGWDFMVIEGMQEMLAARTAEVLLFEVGDNWSCRAMRRRPSAQVVLLLARPTELFSFFFFFFFFFFFCCCCCCDIYLCYISFGWRFGPFEMRIPSFCMAQRYLCSDCSLDNFFSVRKKTAIIKIILLTSFKERRRGARRRRLRCVPPRRHLSREAQRALLSAALR